MVIEQKKVVNISILAPLTFGLTMIAYHIFGNLWSELNQQLYYSVIQFGFIISLLWITSYFLPLSIKRMYRYGFSGYFTFILFYRIYRYMKFDFMGQTFKYYFWVFGCIFLIIFSLYLLRTKNTINTCKN